MRNMKMFLLCLLVIAPMAGCAFGTDYVHMGYTAAKAENGVGKGETVYVARAKDSRPEAPMIGEKRNTVGMRTGSVALAKGQELDKAVTDALADCLSSYGYNVKQVDSFEKKVEDKNVKVLCTSIDDFWTWPVMGLWTVDAASRMRLSICIKEQGTNQVVWSKDISAEAKASAQVVTEGLFNESVNRLMTNEMAQFCEAINSADFVNASRATGEAKE